MKIIQNLFNILRPIKPLHVGYDIGSKKNPTILMLHGIGATHHTWDGLISNLSTDNYRLIAIDLLGFGDSPMPFNCEYSADDHVKYLRKTIKKLKIKKPYTIMGHSMGSIIAIRYCKKYPKDIKSAYLLSLPVYLKATKKSKIANTLTDIYIKAYGLLSQNKDFAIKYSKHLRNILKIEDGLNVDERTWHSFNLSLKNTIIKQHVYNDVKNTKMPMHIIFGALDEFLISKNVYCLDEFKHVSVTKIPAVSHIITTRFAKKVANIVKGDNCSD